jgi:hypothetical protein
VTIITAYYPPPIPVRCYDWSAITDSYDGAPDSKTRHQIGYGETEQAAIENLKDLLEEDQHVA